MNRIPLSPRTLTVAEIERRLAEQPPPGGLRPPRFDFVAPRCAAVLVALVEVDGEWHLLMTRRTDVVQDHKGQVAFPGGACEPFDGSDEVTALRETFEEIGVPAEDVRILGRLPKFVVITGYEVQPVVGTFPYPYPFKLAPDEVSRVFTIPLTWLCQPENRSERAREWQGRSFPVIYFELYDGELLWGASARMALDLLVALKLVEE